MPASILRLHHFEPRSRANGPGLRSVLWVQGCTLNCPGCFNPQSHDRHGGEDVTIEKLFARINAQAGQIEGITLSGGEPLQQAPGVAELLALIRQHTSFSVVLFTGFSWEEVLRLPQAGVLLGSIDILLAGRYRLEQRVARGLLGSNNKTIHFLTGRYSQADLDRIPPAEVIIGPDGDVRFSGIEPLHW